MTPGIEFVTAHIALAGWDWHPSVVVGCLGLLIGYGWVTRFKWSGRSGWWLAGIGLLLFALVSPLDTLGDSYLFSAHMAQHLLLVLGVPPLLLAGLPEKPLRRLLERHKSLSRLERGLSLPLVAWLLGIGVMWVWHLPVLYEATLKNESVHILEHLSFLVASTVFWWPILTPLVERRYRPLPSMLYLFGAALSSSALGIFLTFAPPGIYPTYLHPTDTLGILNMLRNDWGLTPALDQQLGGLSMWVVASPVYLAGVGIVLARWHIETEQAGRLAME